MRTGDGLLRLVAAAAMTLVVGACSPGGSPGSVSPASPGSASPGSASPAAAASDGRTDRTLYSFDNGLIRTVHVHHPASAEPGAPLVLVLHGAQGSGLQAERDFGWDALADREGIVVAYPDGVTPTWGGGVDDAGYLHSMVGALVAGEQADRRRVYAVGMADGGTQAYALACSHPGDLAGIGAVAAAPADGCAHPAPVTVATVLGGADRAVPLAAGPRAGLDGPALDRALAPFRTADHCAGLPAAPLGSAAARSAVASAPVHTLRAGSAAGRPAVPGRPAAPVAARPALAPTTSVAGPVAQRSWTCAGGHSVSVAVVAGAGHQWPGSTARTAGLDEPSRALDATAWLWSHLRTARTS